MKITNLKIKKVGLFICPLSLLIFNNFARAQSIVPAADGTGTAVTPSGNRYDIGGGSLSGDGANLFHSFEQFGLKESQIANFLTDPAIQNILGRVRGGDASLINGLITVTGGNSNLFLINPAGILFGSNASLNVPAAFTATTATNVGFGSNWFNAAGSNNFSALVGTPNAFYFGAAQPGSIFNAANLAVLPGQNLSLLGGTVISTGNLSAPGGQITVAAVPGENVLRISQPGYLLSLEIKSGGSLGNSQLTANPLALPQLLTGEGTSGATGVAVAGDGTVRLVDSGLQVNAGDVAISVGNVSQTPQLNAGNARILAANNLALDGVRLYATGNLSLTAPNAVRVRDSAANPFLARAGGNLSIQADRAIDILTQNAIGGLPLAPQFQSGGNLSLVSNGIISGDAHFASRGNFAIRNLSGMPGNFVSLFDPIVSSEGDVFFGDYTGASLKIEAKGSIVGQNITITAPDIALIGNVSADADIAILTGSPALILRAGLLNLTNTPNVPNESLGDSETPNALGEDAIFNARPILSNNLIVADNISAAGPVILSAPGNVITRDINGGQIQLESTAAAVIVGGRLTSGSTVNIQARDNIILTNEVIRGDVSGNVSLNTSGGNIETRSIDLGNSGAIALTAFGNVNAGNLTAASLNASTRGNITIGAIATSGNIRIVGGGSISTNAITVKQPDSVGTVAARQIQEPTNSIPTVNLDAQNDINVESIDAPPATIALRSSENLNTGNLSGGAVDVNSDRGNIAVGNTASTGNINLTGAGNVTTRNLQGDGVNVNSSGGNINTANAAATRDVNVAAPGNVTTRNLQGDGVNVNSSGGNINTANAAATRDLNVAAPGNVTTGNLQGDGVNVNSSSGNINTANVAATGNVSLRAPGNVNSGNLGGERINLNSNAGSAIAGNITAAETVDINAQQIQTNSINVSPTPDGVNRISAVNLNAQNNIRVASVSAPDASIVSRVSGDFNAGNLAGAAVDINSGGNIAIGNTEATTGNVGLTASGNITSGNLRGVGIDVNSSNGTASTGNITASERVGVSAGNEIKIGQINFNPVGISRTPTVNLNARNDISVASINAPGGNVNIETPRFVRVTDTFNQNDTLVSISTVGGSQLGGTTINHGGGRTNPPTPFTIGDATVNGTKGAIVPTTNQQTATNPSLNNPRISNPATNNLTPNNPLTDNPLTENLLTRNPLTDNPLTNNPLTENPLTNNPLTNNPLTNNPLTGNPNLPQSPVNRVFPEPNRPLTPQQQQIQTSIALDIGKPREIIESGRIQAPRIFRNPLDSNARSSVLQAVFRSDINRRFEAGKIPEAISLLDKSFSQEFRQYFNLNLASTSSGDLTSPEEVQKKLAALGAETGTKPALIYLFSRREQLDLVLVTASGPVVSYRVPEANRQEIAQAVTNSAIVHKSVPQANREELMKIVTQFRAEITKPGARGTTSYLPFAKQLYQWMVAPLEPTLKQRKIDSISFIVDAGLRGFPFAALHDGEQFLIENYNLSLMPSFFLTDTRYIDVRNVQVLAMGASQFSDLNPLPAVPAEIASISRDWPGISFLNDGFTVENLRRQHESRPFGIIHLATHGEFRPGAANNSFIQFWNSRLQLNQLRDLRLSNPQVNLLVLSACRTAVGDEEAELGFGGLAVQSGAQTAVASLWYVSDEGTLGLMSEFYHQLKTAPIKAAALRQAQIAMLRGQVRLEGGTLRGTSRGGGVQLPESLQNNQDTQFVHPYYWSAFVMIGSPW